MRTILSSFKDDKIVLEGRFFERTIFVEDDFIVLKDDFFSAKKDDKRRYFNGTQKRKNRPSRTIFSRTILSSFEDDFIVLEGRFFERTIFFKDDFIVLKDDFFSAKRTIKDDISTERKKIVYRP